MADQSKLAEALTAFHADLPDVAKGSTNPAFKSKYADLADIVKIVLPKLAAQGLAWIAVPTMTEDGFVLAYELRHTSGESVSGSWPLPDPATANQQALGSAVTYAKRYALSAVTGIAPDNDDDGNAASAAGAQRSPSRRKADMDEKITAAVAAINAATTPEKLDEIEAYATRLGITGTPAVKEALEAKRGVLGSSGGDAWAPAEPLPDAEAPIHNEQEQR